MRRRRAPEDGRLPYDIVLAKAELARLKHPRPAAHGEGAEHDVAGREDEPEGEEEGGPGGLRRRIRKANCKLFRK